MTAARKIVTHNSFPPIPVRQFDWCAFYDGEEEAGSYGYGATEAEAVADFIENCAEDHDERLGDPAPLCAIDRTTPEQWAQWARERIEYEDPYGYERGRRW